MDPLKRLEELTQQASALHRTFSAAPLFGVALPVAPLALSAASAAASGEDGDDNSEMAARAEAAFSVRDGVVMVNNGSGSNGSGAGAGAGGVDPTGEGGLDPTAYFADPFKAQVRTCGGGCELILQND